MSNLVDIFIGCPRKIQCLSPTSPNTGSNSEPLARQLTLSTTIQWKATPIVFMVINAWISYWVFFNPNKLEEGDQINVNHTISVYDILTIMMATWNILLKTWQILVLWNWWVVCVYMSIIHACDSMSIYHIAVLSISPPNNDCITLSCGV